MSEPTAGYSARGVLGQVAARMIARPMRALGAAVASAISLAALFVVSGVSESGSAVVSDRFDARRATYVEVSEVVTRFDFFPEDPDLAVVVSEMHEEGRGLSDSFEGYESIVTDVNGVEAAGTLRRYSGVELPSETLSFDGFSVGLVSGDAAEVLQIGMRSGLAFTDYQVTAGSHVALIGSLAATEIRNRLGFLPDLLVVDGQQFKVQGVYDSSPFASDLLLGIIVPEQTGIVGGSETVLVVRTAPGAAQQVADELPLALAPHDPGSLKAVAPPDPVSLRRDVEQEVDSLVLLLAASSALIATLSIGSTMLVATNARLREFGLRRAMGARPADIRRLVICEALLIGAVAGVCALSLGTLGLVAATASREWTTVIDTRLLAAIPALGIVGGMLGGLAPAYRAARLDPVAALRR